MSACMQMPIYLEGENLAARHRHYNSLLKSCVDQQIGFQSIAQIPEISPVDKIFKIDLASQYRNVDYLIEILQDDDMLYVSRALKCLWLFNDQYTNVINPQHLETKLFPHMIQPAVNKMKHWLQLNLKDPDRCQKFYEYYQNEYNIAIKFLHHCSSDFILTEILNIIDKLKPKHLKVICEICPQAAGVYFENLPLHRSALVNYVKEEQKYFKSLKPILKKDGHLYLDLVEKYFNMSKMAKLNVSSTSYVMRNFKSRFNAKPELYATKFLNMKSLATHLTPDEARDLVIVLATAEYLQTWFSFQAVEPLIKRLSVTERTQLKKQVFVDKCFKVCIKEWPYQIPTPLEPLDLDREKVFVDKEYYYRIYEDQLRERFLKCVRKRKCAYRSNDMGCRRFKTPLDILFDRYRVASFERTFQELSKKILTESTIEGRLNMLLVLISKSGGVVSQVNKLLQWLVERHINEPINLRAAVIRSLVKRACAWRLPQDTWNLFLNFGRDLGLGGEIPELLCREGLHAVVIKHLVDDNALEPNVLTAFVREFSTLNEYSLNATEKSLIRARLAILMVGKNSTHLLSIITTYKLKIEQIPGALSSLVTSAKDDIDLLHRLYNAKIGRRELLSLTFPLFQNNESFLNALRHDVSLLDGGKCLAELVAAKEPSRYDRFLRSLALYFNEPNGLAEQHKNELLEKAIENLKPKFACFLCSLLNGSSLLELLSKYDNSDDLDKKTKFFADEIRSNLHKARPTLDMTAINWRLIGAKAVANRLLACKLKDLNNNITSLMSWKRTAKIGFRLSLSSSSSNEMFIRLSTIRPLAALKVALSKYLKSVHIDEEVWNIVKQLIEKLQSHDSRILDKLNKIDSVPKNIRADYWVVILNLNIKFNRSNISPIVCRLENMLPEVDRHTVELLIKQFLSERLTEHDFFEETLIRDKCLYFRIIAKYLLLSQSIELQNESLENICDVFFDKIMLLFEHVNKQTDEDNKNFSHDIIQQCLSEFLIALKYNKVFLDQRYVSCLPVFEKIIMRLRNILSTEKYLHLYVQIHLTMLYYKSIKQAIRQRPRIFDDLANSGKEAVEVVGLIFGTYIGHEIQELVRKYFFSVIELYKKVLVQYLSKYFVDGDKASLLVVNILKGLLNVGHTEAFLLVEYILRKEYSYHIPEPHAKEIYKVLKECVNQEVYFLLYA